MFCDFGEFFIVGFSFFMAICVGLEFPSVKAGFGVCITILSLGLNFEREV